MPAGRVIVSSASGWKLAAAKTVFSPDPHEMVLVNPLATCVPVELGLPWKRLGSSLVLSCMILPTVWYCFILSGSWNHPSHSGLAFLDVRLDSSILSDQTVELIE